MPNPQHRFSVSRDGHSFDFSFLKKEDTEHWIKCLGAVCVLTDFHEKYSAVRLLGMGAFGTVHLVHSRTGREHYAVKGFSKTALTSESSKAGLFNEIAMMRAFNHPRLVKLHEVYESEGSVYLIQEFVPGKTLRAALGKSNTPHHYTEKQVMEIIKALLETLAYFASEGVMHRDLKPDNILIDKNCNVRIIDYGLVTQYEDNMDYIFDRCGTPGYIAPEVFSFNKEDPESAYNDRCDVFSIGCIFFQMLFGRRLFNSNEGHEILKQNKSYSYDDTLDILINEINNVDSKINKDALELLMKMLHEDPEERISAEDALRDVYFEFLSQKITERVNPQRLLQPFSSRHKLSIEGHLFPTLTTQNSANQCVLTVNSHRGGFKSTRVTQENSLHVTESSPEGSELETAPSSAIGRSRGHGNSLTPFRTSSGQYAKFPVGLLHPHPSPKSSRFSVLKSERKDIIEFHAEETENNESSEDDSGDDFELQSCLEEASKVPQFMTCSGKMKLLNMKTIGAGGKC